MLKISNLVVSYGGIEALKGIDLNVEKGKIVTLVGANGAGKSTVLRSIVGLVKKKDGNIEYKGKDLSGIKTQYLSSMGLTLVPEGRRIFSDLTVEENLNLGAYARKDKDGIQKDIKWVYELFPILKERQWQLGGTLSGGEQKEKKCNIKSYSYINNFSLCSETSPILITLVNISICGNGFGIPPNKTIAKFCNKNDTPIAEISIEILGEFLIGLYAALSIVTPKTPVIIIAVKNDKYHGMENVAIP